MIQALLTSTSVRPNFSSTCSAAATSEADQWQAIIASEPVF